jgi:signal transduction histidine kinase
MECDSKHIDHVENGLEQIEQLADEGTMFVTVGREVTDREPLSLASIADDCWEYASSDRGSLTVEETTVHADPERFRRILNELFLNVFVHTEGEVRVEAGPLPDGQGFYVADDGPGISDADREYVFDRGYTTDSERDGNGLAVVEEIVRAHGWEVELFATDGTRVEVRTEQW